MFLIACCVLLYWSSDLIVEMILKLRDVEMRRAIGPVKEVLLRLHDLSHRIGGEKWGLCISGLLCRFWMAKFAWHCSGIPPPP